MGRRLLLAAVPAFFAAPALAKLGPDLATGTLAKFTLAKEPKPLPDLAFTDAEDKPIKLADYKGKTVLLNFWATWCAPCRVELPMLDAYLRRHPGTDLRLFAVTTEGSVPNSKLKPLASMLSFPLATSISGRAYGPLDGVPTNYVIDRGGIVRYAKSGAFTENTFDDVVAPLLAAPAPGKTQAT
jgi:cytochrome c biogenesis protein CcmG, thiol:disulfide interchange protein DsbE